MVDIENLKRLEDYFQYDFTDNDDEILVNGKVYETEILLLSDYPEDYGCRVLIDGEYYYFG